jgi:hypothetical protein
MSNRASNYETLYGVGLLDDLHNYFPALLYDSDSFRTVQDVLQYTALQTRRRFDLYSFGLSSYEETNAGETRRASGGAGASSSEPYQFYQTPLSTAPNAREIPTSPPPRPVLGRPPTTATDRLFRYVIDVGDERFDIGEHDLPNIPLNMSPTMLTTLLAGLQPQMRTNNRVDELSNVVSLLLRLGATRPMQGLEPVVVRPTVEQIASATEIARPNTEQDCAICQDTITTSQDCRKILHCGHWFHKDCIDPWFQQNVQCPICRYDIREYHTNDEETQTPPPSRQPFPEEEYH